MTIPFVDLRVRNASLRRELSAVIDGVVDGAQFVLGTGVATFEQAFARYCGGEHCIGVANGTEALHLALRALGIGPGDEVITAANTFVASALAISYTGASPVLVDVNSSDYLINVDLIERAITPRTKAILPVHLYGQPADLVAIGAIADKYGLALVQDACQAHGAEIDGISLGKFGTAACYSFYPSKNLGAFGDGGAVVTNCSELAGRVRVLRNVGQQGKNEFKVLGYNSRLDTLQAAVLNAKLPYLDQCNERRRSSAKLYQELLADSDVTLPSERPGGRHVFHLYVVRHSQRDELQTHLMQAGVECGIHYPTPVHEIAPFAGARTVPDGAPVSSRLAKQILSLPMYPDLTREEVMSVSSEVLSYPRVALTC